MIVLDFLQLILNSAVPGPQACGPFNPLSPNTWFCVCGNVTIGTDTVPACPGSTFTAIAAAFATEGIWVQANLVQQILTTGLGLWAPILYIFSAIGGLVSLALGAPPKMYLWFFMGPGIYHWLIDTPVHVSGVEWRVADKPQNQREVWKLSEVGLKNSVPVGVQVSNSGPPSTMVEVPLLFVWFDEIISDLVQGMVAWTGVYNQVGTAGGASATSNISGNPSSSNENKWYLLSNLKWGLLEDVTSAKLKSVEVRDSFVTFLSSECGDLLKSSVSNQKFIQAATAQGRDLGARPSVFPQLQIGNGPPLTNYTFLTQNLRGQSIPTPRSMRKLLKDNTKGSFMQFGSFFSSGIINWWSVQDSLNCDGYLWLLIQAFRWEAGHQFFQLVKAAPQGTNPDDLVYTILYGWAIKETSTGMSIDTPEKRRQYLINLILLHLFRNEMAIAPAVVDLRFTASQQAESISKGYQRNIGQKSKYAEVYTWAMMIPYLQGILLYLLAIAYPFACMMVVMPGMHKVIFTWMSFWAWVKLWDVGFAVVLMIERTLWAMLGNGSNAAKLNNYIADMSTLGTIGVGCNGGGGGGGGNATGPLTTCTIPNITNIPFNNAQDWFPAVETFDRAMVLAANLDLDLQNSYYIYLMSALYFAVPTVTGQLVLGARAGSASMVNSAIGGAAQEMGRTAGTAAQSEGMTQLHTNAGSVAQAAYAKSLRGSGLGQKAIEYGNQGMREDMAGSALGTANSAAAKWRENRNMESQSMRNNAGAGSSMVGLGTKLFGGDGKSNIPKEDTSSTGAPGDSSPQVDDPAVGRPIGATPPKIGEQTWGNSLTKPDPDASGLKNASDKMLKNATKGDSVSKPAETDSNFQAAAKALARAAKNYGGAVTDAAVSAGIAANSNAAYGDIAVSNALSADADIASFKHGGEAKGYNAHAGRVGEQAGFEADNAKWEAMNAFSSQLAGYSSGVLGNFSGGLTPGPKPLASVNAMASDNLLGSGAKAAFNYTNPENTKAGSYRHALSNTADRLSADFGAVKTANAYQSWTPLGALGESFQHGAQLISGSPGGGGRSGGDLLSSNFGTNGGRVANASPEDNGAGAFPQGRSGNIYAPSPARANGVSHPDHITASTGAGPAARTDTGQARNFVGGSR